MKTWIITTALIAVAACGPKPGPEEAGPEPAEPKVEGPPPKPHIDVPPLSSYAWLKTAGIIMARPEEQAAMEAKLGDFYSGLPNFMAVLAMATKDRNVGLRNNPAFLSDIWKEYLSMVGRSEEDPPTALDEFDLGMCKYAIFRAWKSENPLSGVDNYDDAITTVSFGE
jgi:hypothetical protein